MNANRNFLLPLLFAPAIAFAQGNPDSLALASGISQTTQVVAGAACPTTPTVVYDTTRIANQGAEVTAAANGAATCMGDLIVLSAATTQRQICEVSIDLFTLAAVTPFDLTMEFYTACTTNGAGGSACGTGPGTLIAGSTSTITGITPPALGALFTVTFPYPGLVDLSGEADNTISVKLNASRSDVFWRINETPVIGAIPAGEPATSFVERCGSSAANNGCQRNFGVNNNFGMTIRAVDGTPPALLSGTKTVSGSFQPGGAITYTVVLNNTGAGAQGDNPGNEFTDVLPASLVLVSATSTSGTTVANTGTNTVTWDGAIAASGSATITINATVAGSATPGSTVSNQGTISFDGNGDGTNESSTATDDPSVGGASDPTNFIVALPPPALVSGTKTVSGSFQPGGAIAYTVVLNNTGAGGQGNNPGSEFTDVLPASLVLVSATASSGTAVANTGTNTVTWDGAIAASGSVTITINATVAGSAIPGSTVSNQGTISYDGTGDGTNESSAVTDDPSIGGASDPTSFLVGALPPALVSGTKTVSGSFQLGGAITYTIVLTNSGVGTQGDYAGDEFSDLLPASLVLVSASANSGTALANVGTNTVTWNGSIGPSGSVTITINATVATNAASGTTVSNQGVISFDGDGDTVNESTAVTDDPAASGASDPTNFVIPAGAAATVELPSLGTLAQLFAGLLLAMFGFIALRKRNRPNA